MPCTFEFNVDRSLIEILYRGRVTPDCVLKPMDSFDATPRRIAKHNELRDHRNITDLTMDPQQLDDLAELTRGTYLRAGVRKRIAFVAPDGPGRAFALALSEALGTLTQLQVALFDTQETALQFLNDGHSNGDPSRRAG